MWSLALLPSICLRLDDFTHPHCRWCEAHHHHLSKVYSTAVPLAPKDTENRTRSPVPLVTSSSTEPDVRTHSDIPNQTNVHYRATCTVLLVTELYWLRGNIHLIAPLFDTAFVHYTYSGK